MLDKKNPHLSEKALEKHDFSDDLAKLKNTIMDPDQDFERIQKALNIKALMNEINNSNDFLFDWSTKTQEKYTQEPFLINGKIQQIYFINNKKGGFGGTFHNNKIVINLGVEENIYSVVNALINHYYPLLAHEPIEQSVTATIKQEYFHMIDSQTRGIDPTSHKVAESLSEVESLEISDYYFVYRYSTALKNLVFHKYKQSKNPSFKDGFDGSKHYSFDGKTSELLRDGYQYQRLCYYRALEKVLALPENTIRAQTSFEKLFKVFDEGQGKINFGSDVRTYDKLIHDAFGHHVNQNFIKSFIKQYKIECSLIQKE